MKPYRQFGKRLLDLVLAMVILAPLSLPLLLIAVAVRIRLGQPVFFRQTRPGRLNRPFVIIKFRTMLEARAADGSLLPDAYRLTHLGRFLRKASLDELPEFINVLKGDMSLVGPRPLLTQYLDRYTPDQLRRHEIRPGITGLAQVSGRNTLTWEEKFALDVWYVDHLSFWLDLKLLALTAWKVLKREGISQTGHATMEEFLGSAK